MLPKEFSCSIRNALRYRARVRWPAPSGLRRV